MEQNKECIRPLQYIDKDYIEKEALSQVCRSLLLYESIYDVHLCHSRKGKTTEMVDR